MSRRVRFTVDSLGGYDNRELGYKFTSHHRHGEQGVVVDDWQPPGTLGDWLLVETDDGHYVPVHPRMIEDVKPADV